MRYQAHRGVSTEYPENTIPAFAAAADQGYEIIELDPIFTADEKCVVFHDRTVNRTCRNEDGSEISEPLPAVELTYAQITAYDAGLFMGEQFRGIRVPLFEEVLQLAVERDLEVKIDNKVFRNPPHLLQKLFDIVEASGAKAGFTCANGEAVKAVVARFAGAPIHYDGPVDEKTLKEITGLLKENELTVWAPMPSKLTAWVKVPLATPALCAMIKDYARLGIWILETQAQLEEARALGADVIETTGSLKPNGG